MFEDTRLDNNIEENSARKEKVEKIGQEQFYNFLMKEEMSWQEIIYDLINTEQLDPWDINLLLLTQKYLEKIHLMEEMNFFMSSKVLLVASLLLRIKSEILLNKNIRSLDDILFGKEEEKKYEVERIDFDESQIPILLPRTPLPRFRKINIDELMSALSKAVNTETRRIKREILDRNALIDANVFLPAKRINWAQRIKEIYEKIRILFQQKRKIHFDELAGEGKEERIATFIPLLHLDTQEKVWIEQEKHLDDIWILLSKMHSDREALRSLFGE